MTNPNPIKLTNEDVAGVLHSNDPAINAMFHDACMVARYGKITLDGEKVEMALMADEAAGEVRCFKRDAQGQVIIEGDAPKVFSLKGDVRIGLNERATEAASAALERLRAAGYGVKV